jgi:hypothetical protein
MKRYFLLIAALLAVIITANAQKMLDLESNVFLDTLDTPTVDKTVTETENGYRVRYEFKKALILPDDVYSACDVWKFDGFFTSGAPSMPMYPYASDSFTIPTGCVASIQVVDEEWLLEESAPAPGRLPLCVSDTIGYSKSNISPVRTDLVGWYPTNSVIDNGTHSYKGIDIVNIGISPVQFDCVEGTAKVCKTLEYEISFSKALSSSTESSLDTDSEENNLAYYFEDPYLSATTINWEYERANANSDELSEDSTNNTIVVNTETTVPKYLIISVPTYKDAVETFATWKRKIGYNVTTVYQDSWVQGAVSEAIAKYDNLSYLLIVGNNNNVPGNKNPYSEIGRSVISDLNYACSDPYTSIIPEFSYGRIPVNTLEEATRVLNRIIKYEQEPDNSSDFYKSHLFLTSFLGSKGVATMRNSQTTYEISKYLEDKGLLTKNLFKNASDSVPLYWVDPGYDEDGIFCVPCPVPSSLRVPNFSWTASTSDIMDAINSGYSQVFYFGHGIDTAWGSPSFNTYNAYNLSNGNKCPVVFSMACLTCNYSTTGSLGEKFLTAPAGGALGVLGFTNNTYVGYTDVIATSLYNGIYPSPGFSSTISSIKDRMCFVTDYDLPTTTELGALQRLAITEIDDIFPTTGNSPMYKSYEASMFTLLGDPSMKICLSKPLSYVPNITTDGTNYIINVPNIFTTTIYNSKKLSVKNYKGKVTIPIGSSIIDSDATICIHKDGAIPYFWTPSTETSSMAKNKISENGLVKEDRIWKYSSDGFLSTGIPTDTDSDSEEPLKMYLNLKFSGITNIDDKDYYNCYVWKDDQDFNESTAILIAYMREDNGKVYVRYIPEAINLALDNDIELSPTSPVMDTETDNISIVSQYDVLVYDNSLSEGDSFYTLPEDNEFTHKMKVTNLSEKECMDKQYRVWTINQTDWYNNRYHYYENIGDIYGLIPFPSPIPYFYSFNQWDLEKVVDLDGNVIFETSKITSGVKNLTDDRIVTTKYFTLDGKAVTKPSQPGIYIKSTISASGVVTTEKAIVK